MLENIIPIVVVPVVFGSMVAITALIIRFKLKNKELEVREKEVEMHGSDSVDTLRDDLDDTRAQLADMQEHTQAQLAEMQERLDFAERMLTAGRESQEDRSG